MSYSNDNYQNHSSGEPGVPEKKPIGFAVTSMVLGIVSVVFSLCLPFVSIITAIVGLVLGSLSLKRNLGGKNMAIAGIVLSIVFLALSVIFIATIGGILMSLFTMF